MIYLFIATFLLLIGSIFAAVSQPKKNNAETKYVGATDIEVEKMLDTLYEESCYYPFEHIGSGD
jgi:hypothetical protein